MNTPRARSGDDAPGARRAGERGASAVEYAILGSLVAAVIVVTVGLLGTGTGELFQEIVDAFPG